MAGKSALTILTGARELVSDIDHWGQGRLHRVVRGADRYCLMGAINKAATGNPLLWRLPGDTQARHAAMLLLSSCIGSAWSVVHFNDAREKRAIRHKKILDALDCAIAKAAK